MHYSESMLIRFYMVSLCGLFLLACGPSLNSSSSKNSRIPKVIEGAEGSADQRIGSATCEEPALDPEANAAFERAEEFYTLKFLTFRTGPNEIATAKLRELTRLTNQARENYLQVIQFGKTKWVVASLVRLGDIFRLQGRTVLTLPIPNEVMELDAKFPEKKILVQYQRSLQDVVDPLIELARETWTKGLEANEEICTETKWVNMARERLAATKQRVKDPSEHKSPKSDSSASAGGEKSASISMAKAMTEGPSVNCTDGKSSAGSAADYDAKLVLKHCVSGKDDVAGPLLLLTFDAEIVAKAERDSDGKIHSCQLMKPNLLATAEGSRFGAIARACK